MYPSNDGILPCLLLDLQRRDLLAGVLAILRPFGHNNLKVLKQYLWYGNKDLSIDLNRKILELTLAFIHNTGRLIEVILIIVIRKVTIKSLYLLFFRPQFLLSFRVTTLHYFK